MTQLPSFLIAFPFLDSWKPDAVNHHDWILDSGAWSVWNAGGSVDLAAYIRACKGVLDSEQPPRMIFALDEET